MSDLLEDPAQKIVVFSQWERMIRLAELSVRDILEAGASRSVIFSGSLSMKKREAEIKRFLEDAKTRVFFSADAGGVGLNLQHAANVVVNLEIPWNPAVMEQRIGRVYRMGQKKSVQAINLISWRTSQSPSGWEVRDEQRDMALAVQEALQKQKHLIVEAGTGVGKSIAYLLPSALWAVEHKKKVVIATCTKALQEQLIRKDLPIVKETLGHAGLEFNYALLMGAENYLCRQRLERCLGQEKDFFATASAEDTLTKLHAWCGEASTGLRTKIPFKVADPLWQMVCRDSDICLGKKGPYWENCLYRKDMDRARAADILVINQHLL